MNNCIKSAQYINLIKRWPDEQTGGQGKKCAHLQS
jgi:hypothetical protein